MTCFFMTRFFREMGHWSCSLFVVFCLRAAHAATITDVGGHEGSSGHQQMDADDYSITNNTSLGSKGQIALSVGYFTSYQQQAWGTLSFVHFKCTGADGPVFIALVLIHCFSLLARSSHTRRQPKVCGLVLHGSRTGYSPHHLAHHGDGCKVPCFPSFPG